PLPPLPHQPKQQDHPTPREPAVAKPAPIPTPTATLKNPPPPARVTSPTAPAPKPEERLPFVITHSGNLVFISDKPFKFEKLRRESSALLSEDHNFRVARDRFSSEPVFLFFNVALEDKKQPKPSPTPAISEEKRELQERDEET